MSIQKKISATPYFVSNLTTVGLHSYQLRCIRIQIQSYNRLQLKLEYTLTISTPNVLTHFFLTSTFVHVSQKRRKNRRVSTSGAVMQGGFSRLKKTCYTLTAKLEKTVSEVVHTKVEPLNRSASYSRSSFAIISSSSS